MRLYEIIIWPGQCRYVRIVEISWWVQNYYLHHVTTSNIFEKRVQKCTDYTGTQYNEGMSFVPPNQVCQSTLDLCVISVSYQQNYWTALVFLLMCNILLQKWLLITLKFLKFMYGNLV